MPQRSASPEPYNPNAVASYGSAGTSYGSLSYPPPASDDRLRRLLLHDVCSDSSACDAFVCGAGSHAALSSPLCCTPCHA